MFKDLKYCGKRLYPNEKQRLLFRVGSIAGRRPSSLALGETEGRQGRGELTGDKGTALVCSDGGRRWPGGAGSSI